jgi:arylsulfatase A-like enzyme
MAHDAQRILALIFVAALASCSNDDRGAARNVLLVTVDCLRADRLSAAGYERRTTPNIDALAARGVRFENAFSTAPFTAPSHASLLTSLDQASHGVVFWGQRLASGAITFGDLFSESGRRTAAFHNHPSLVSTGITRGCDDVVVHPFGPWNVTTQDFAAWLDARGEEPFAAWVHLWDAHRPYGFRSHEGDTGASLRARGVPERHAYAEKFFGPEHDVRVGRHEGFYNLSRDERAAPIEVGGTPRRMVEADWRYIEARYDNAVREADEGVGALIAELERRGLLDDTLIVVTADHGETLRERDGCWFTHDPYLTNETLNVPLVIAGPGVLGVGRVRSDVASGVDVLPTLLDACDVDAPATLQGRSLLTEPAPGAERLAFAQTRALSAKESDARAPDGGWVEWREAVTDGRTRLVFERDTNTWSAFDLAADPGERENLLAAGDWPQALLDLRARADARRAQLPVVEPGRGTTTPQERELLEKLGYLDREER